VWLPAEEAKEPAAAKWEVKGLGFVQNRTLKKQLNLIFHQRQKLFEASDIEDAALVLVSFLQTQGYLEASAIATLTKEDGSVETVEWDSSLDVFLSRETAANHVRFDLVKGPRFFYESLEIEGVKAMDLVDAESFFYSPPLMFQGRESLVFTHSLLKSGVSNLKVHLNSLGYISAQADFELVSLDKESGAVSVRIEVEEGPIYRFRNLVILGEEKAEFQPEIDETQSLGQPYSRFLMQDIVRMIRNQYYENGYPEVIISSKRILKDESSTGVDVELEVNIEPGPRIVVADVGFEGSKRTKERLLNSRLAINEGDLFNPSHLDESRLNLSRLGVFDKIVYDTESLSDDRRSISFLLNERPIWNGDLLLGWGSYELARFGVKVERINMLGLGHRVQFRSIVSMKSLLGEGRYLIPEFLGSRTSLSTKLFGLDREEASFDRVERGFDIAASRHIRSFDLDADAVYTFQSLEARNIQSTEDLELEERKAGSIEFRLGRDKRDSPLNPKQGYRLFGRFEYAADFLGGEVDYQRAEIGASWHGEISRGLYWHAGLTHGVVGSFNESQSQVPYLKLFFPGGENSVRGYQRGEASPMDDEGNILGATSYILANLELEQMLSETLSVVLFVDGLGSAAEVGEYPFDETLGSVGLGLRLRTFMGPVRVEYGANINRREFDPGGTVHFSLGYPF